MKTSKSSNLYLVLAFAVAFGVLVLIPVWFALDAVETDSGHHGPGEMIPVEEFRAKVEEQMEKYGLPDGSLRPPPGTVYVLAEQFEFIPDTIRLSAGEHYKFAFLSPDVLHGVSLIQGMSLNGVVMPKMVSPMEIEPTREGEILMLCTEYCGEGHDMMRGRIIVEAGRELAPGHGHEEEDHHGMEGNHQDEGDHHDDDDHHDEKPEHHDDDDHHDEEPEHHDEASDDHHD
jgi:heme/copper-type cytochrome/quinol oxidase subunit 2